MQPVANGGTAAPPLHLYRMKPDRASALAALRKALDSILVLLPRSTTPVVIFDIDGTALLPDNGPMRAQRACPHFASFYNALRLSAWAPRLRVHWVTARDGHTPAQRQATVVQLKEQGFMQDPRELVVFADHALIGPVTRADPLLLLLEIARQKRVGRRFLCGRIVGPSSSIVLLVGNQWPDLLGPEQGLLPMLAADASMQDDACLLLRYIPGQNPFSCVGLKVPSAPEPQPAAASAPA